MSSSIAPSGPGSSGSGPTEPSGPSPAGMAGLLYERIVMLAGSYDRTADELLALTAQLRAAEAAEWKGQAGLAYRTRLEELTAEVQSAAHGYRTVAAELRAGAAGLSAQIGAVEQFLDLGTLGASVLGVLAQAEQSIPQHGPAGLLR